MAADLHFLTIREAAELIAARRLSPVIVGRLFDEATVLRAGDTYERVTPWRQRRPALPMPMAA
jgi:hypothetical protein